MKATRKILAGAIATTIAFGAFAPVANAEISASAGVANIYLWRGIDLGRGEGTPAISGDITASAGGFYGTLWTSSGDAAYGTEWDIGAGYGGEAGIFSYDISVWNYLYPTDSTVNMGEDSFGDLTEVIVSLGLGPVSFSWYENVATGTDETYRYFTLGYGLGDFSATVGGATGDDTTEYVHVDLSYAYNDNLSFTFSQITASGKTPEGADEYDDDLNFVVSYSMPIE